MTASLDGIRAMMMRGGTSKGVYFLAEDLPADPDERDTLLLQLMGSPDARQIDGLGGAHPLTSKVAVVSPNAETGGVNYLFLQVFVDEAVVTDKQNCGNILAGIGPFAIERGLVPITGDVTRVPISLVNSGGSAVAEVQTPGGKVRYSGDTRLDGVPGSAAAVVVNFSDTAGSTTGNLLPSGNLSDVLAGVPVTLIDNGMPVVVMAATDMGITGRERPEELEQNAALREKLEEIRLEAGQLMGLGDVTELSVPKLTMVSEPFADGHFSTRTFIPHRCHQTIGVLGAASVAAAAALGAPQLGSLLRAPDSARYRVEHPTGAAEVELELEGQTVQRTAVVLTARKLFDGLAFPREY